MKAIPTTINGLTFRSRLEATWSLFFDLCQWPWEYEPFDLNGYIPDFVLKFPTPILVEVKSEVLLTDLLKHTQKIDDAGWESEAVVVGATLFQEPEMGYPSLGIIREWNDPDTKSPIEGGWVWSSAVFMDCPACKRVSFYHYLFTWSCRACDHYDGDHFTHPEMYEVGYLWNVAKTKSQWKPGSL